MLRLPSAFPHFTVHERDELTEEVVQLGMSALGWCMVWANAYFEKFPGTDFMDHDAAAACDYLVLTGRRGE